MYIAINLLFIRPGMVGDSEIFVVNLVKNLLKLDKVINELKIYEK